MKNPLDSSNKSLIKIYADSGANIKFLKNFYSYCVFITFPYDSAHRRKVFPKPVIAAPSALQWRDFHLSWNEAKFPSCECNRSEIYDSLEKFIGKSNRRDILHLDSAYKEKVGHFSD